MPWIAANGPEVYHRKVALASFNLLTNYHIQLNLGV
jgi:hypothetical protein